MTDDYLAIYRQIIERNVAPELEMQAESRAAIAKVASAATS
jgi:hypothetical protein